VNDHKQLIAFSLVVVGLIFTFVAGWYHFSELSTCAVGVTGAGCGMLKGSDSNTVTNGGTVAVNADPTV